MLLIDNGNTRTKFAVYNKGELRHDVKVVNADLAVTIDQTWVKDIKLALGTDTKVFGCSVGTAADRLIISERLAQSGLVVEWLKTSAEAGGVTNGYNDCWQQLGADRWFALVGYYQLKQENALIIDAGTALTIDWLVSDGRHLGGWIVPGRRLMQQSLHSGTANLNALLSESCYREPAVNTQQGMSFGVHYALVGAISQAIKASEHIFNQQPFSIIVTGGDGERLVKSLQAVESINYTRIDDLVFKGLAFAADN